MGRDLGMRVDFDSEEIRRWAYAGVDRRVSAMAKNRKGAHGFNRSDFWQLDLEGLLAEAAVAKALGVYYAPVTGALDTGLGDVLPGIQVRSTKYDTGSLLVHDSDADSDLFLLVTGASGSYIVRGYISGKDAKNPSFTKTHKGRTAYWVPQSALRVLTPDRLDELKRPE
jgi:hypothetical protein